MNDIKQAYETLGLSPDASRDEVEKRYDLLLRKEKNADIDGRIASINQAYRLIRSKDHEQRVAEKSKNQSRLGAKLEHFWTYYKLHTIGAVIAVVLAVTIIQGVLDHRREQAYLASLPPASLEIMIYGDFYKPDMEQFEQNLLMVMEDWERIRTIFTFFPLQANDQFDVAYQQKSILSLQTERPEMYIADEENFDRLMFQHVYQPLDDMEEALSKAFGEENLIYRKAEDDAEEHLYGVNLKGNPVFDKVFARKEMDPYVGISVVASQQENAEKLLLALGSSAQQ